MWVVELKGAICKKRWVLFPTLKKLTLWDYNPKVSVFDDFRAQSLILWQVLNYLGLLVNLASDKYYVLSLCHSAASVYLERASEIRSKVVTRDARNEMIDVELSTCGRIIKDRCQKQVWLGPLILLQEPFYL